MNQFPVPEGWFAFGTHVDCNVPLEFSQETGEDGLPQWERPMTESTESAADQGEGGLKWHERDALARAMHQTWHIGCHRECGGRLADSIKSDRVIAPAVERILAARTAALRAEVEQLRRWKAEALPVIDGLQDLGRALDLPPGTRITGPDAVEAARQLRARADRAS